MTLEAIYEKPHSYYMHWKHGTDNGMSTMKYSFVKTLAPHPFLGVALFEDERYEKMMPIWASITQETECCAKVF